MRETPTIWLIEDCASDAMLVEEVLTDSGIRCDLVRARDGEEGIGLIDHLAGPEDCPDLILLDVNLPKADGHEVLAHLRQHQLCQEVPVIITTSSDAPRDQERARRLGVQGFFRKPSQLDGFTVLVNLIQQLLHGPSPAYS